MTKATAIPCLVDENGSEASVNDHEKLGAENEDLEELHAKNELNNMPIIMSIMMNYVLRVKGKMNGCKRMFISNGGRCMLETNNVNTKSKKPKIMQRNKHCSNNFCNKSLM
jgi:hypothetical protein